MNNPFKFKQFTIHQDKCAMKVGTDGVLMGAWTSLDIHPESILDIGAGFEGHLTEDWKSLWIKRSIDSSRSQFLNRPTLDAGLSMNEERFHGREKRYDEMSDYELELLEHIKDHCPYEEKYYTDECKAILLV